MKYGKFLNKKEENDYTKTGGYNWAKGWRIR
jgi:hypothetical protein